MQSSPSPKVVRFGIFEADLEARELRKSGLKLRLSDQPFFLLAALLDRPGEIVTREELRQRIWPADTFVDFDHSISAAMNKLRETLGDSAETPRFIETLPRKGYRFIAPVEKDDEGKDGRNGQRRWLLVAIAVVAIVAAGAAWFWSKPSKGPAAAPVPVPLTAYPGCELAPSLSPDGSQVAFSWNGDRQDNHDIYVLVIGAGVIPLRVSTHPAPESSPAWSPDGRFIAFLRFLAGKTSVVLTPALGGAERVLTDTNPLIFEDDRRNSQLAWTPDSKWLAYPDDRGLLSVVSAETGEKRPLTQAGLIGDQSPAFSPDGRALAFARVHGFFNSQIHLLSLSPDLVPHGEPKRLTFETLYFSNPAWTAGGEALVYSAGQFAGVRHLSRIAADGVLSGKSRLPQPETLTFAGDESDFPSISAARSRMVFARMIRDSNIWRVNATGGRPVPARPLISSTRRDEVPQFSPDGKKVLFTSDRSGTWEVWVSNADGSAATQLTSMRAVMTGSPRWSPDGQQIVFDSVAEGQFEIYVVGADGGSPLRLTDHPADDAVASWSRNGKWIYFGSDRSGQWQVWKMPAGGGSAFQVTKGGGRVALESRDGRTLYYTLDISLSPLYRMPVEGGAETKLAYGIEGLAWAVAERGIYFIGAQEPSGRRWVLLFDLRTGRSRPVVPIDRPVGTGLAVSPDGRSILYVQVDQEGSDLMLVENFR